jgi:hypothetical protein
MLRVEHGPWNARLRGRWFPALLLLVGVLLLLCRLDDIYLWQDEAETALVSRHLLAYGLPLSTDGTDWVQQAPEAFVEFTPDYVWIYHSWLQYALTAAALALLGSTTLAARAPFALAGLATLLFFYHFLRRWLVPSERIARVGSVLLLLSVPFLLLMRQDRYYALAAFFTLLTLDAYLQLRAGKPRAVPYFILSSVLLYHSHYGAFFPTMAALAVHWAVCRPAGQVWRFLPALVVSGALVVPWALFMRVLARGQTFRLDRFLGHLGQYVVNITGWVLPVLVAVILWIAWLRRSKGGALALNQAQASFCQLATLVILVNILVLSANAAFDWVFFRYIVHLIPLLVAMLAIVVVLVLERWPLVGYVMLAALALGNGVHVLPYGLPGVRTLNPARLWPGSPAFEALRDVWSRAGHIRSDVLMYAQELTHEYQGPNEGLVAYLAAHARPGQSLLVNYEDLPLMFYTPLRVWGGLGAHGLESGPQPDWVVDRKYGPYRDQLASIVARGAYERIELPYPDIRWENRPEPGSHNFLSAQGADSVVIYRRRGD